MLLFPLSPWIPENVFKSDDEDGGKNFDGDGIIVSSDLLDGLGMCWHPDPQMLQIRIEVRREIVLFKFMVETW